MGRLAYLFDRFPALSETFFQREIRGLAGLGLEPILVSNLKPDYANVHATDRGLAEKTFYIYSPKRFGQFVTANLGLFFHYPGRYLRALSLALTSGEGRPWQRIKNLGMLAGAAVLGIKFARDGVTHVHAHFALGAAGLAVYLQILTGLPYSLSIHGSDVLLPQTGTGEKLENASFIVTNCEYHVQYLRDKFPSLGGRKFYLVRLMLELGSGLWLPTRPPLPLQPLRILNVARLHPVKAHEVLIRACGLLAEQGVPFECRIVGEGPTRTKLESLISELGLGDRIELMGALDELEVARMYDWSHVFVLSSTSEGTPMTIVEAMAKGRPVVAPEITALPEMVRHGQTGFLFPAASAPGLYECLAELAGTPDLIERMGAQGLRQVQKNHDLVKKCPQAHECIRTGGAFSRADAGVTIPDRTGDSGFLIKTSFTPCYPSDIR